MLRVLGRKNSINVQKLLWTLSELNVAYNREDYGGKYCKLDTAEFIALNPNKLIPVLIDNDFVMYESNATMRYLGEKYSSSYDSNYKLWSNDIKVKATIDKYLDWQMSTLYPPVRTIFLTLIRTPENKRNLVELSYAYNIAKEKFTLLESLLSDGREYIVGDDFTLADIALGITAHRWIVLNSNWNEDRVQYTNVEKWYERLRSRSAFQTHIGSIPLT